MASFDEVIYVCIGISIKLFQENNRNNNNNKVFVVAGTGGALEWKIRLKIAIGAARGLAFLHSSENPVIYRDFKTANILLDEVIRTFCFSIISIGSAISQFNCVVLCPNSLVILSMI